MRVGAPASARSTHDSLPLWMEEQVKVLDIETHEYQGVWKLWKVASVGLFALFVLILADIAKTLRRYCG